MRALAAFAIAALLGPGAAVAADAPIRVGSKNFAEQFVVADIYAEALEDAGFKVERKINLGTTAIAHAALVGGQIDLYPEYTGTALAAVVKAPATGGAQAVYQRVKAYYARNLGLAVLAPTSVNNSYALVVRPDTAARDHLTTLSSLAPVAPRMVIGAPGEFQVRDDGVPALARVYGIRFKALRAFAEQRLRYEALMAGDLEVIDAYSTDWQIADRKLVVLADDRHVFPPYQLVPIVRQDTLRAHPGLAAALERIGPYLTDARMREMNAAVERDRREPAEVAHRFLADNHLLRNDKGAGPAACGGRPLCWTTTHGRDIAVAAAQHLYLSVVSVAFALVIALVLGVISARRPRLYALFLTLATAVFVAPALALFALLIPWLGLGVAPALVGLTAYGVLILLRNVVTGLRSVPPEVLDAADGLGFGPIGRLLRVELPLALPLIVSGVRIALVTAVGAATIAAFIDAGGLGDIILTGISQAYPEKILVGGGAAALMAIGFDQSIGWLARRLEPWRRAPA